MKRITFISMLLLFFLFSTFSSIIAQEEPDAPEKQKKETPYWYVSSFKIPWEKVDSLQKLIKMYTIPTLVEVKKIGRLLDYHILIHNTGDEYNVVIMSKFSSWEALDKGAGWTEASKVVEPDEEKRKKVSEAFNWVFEGSVHKDNIYSEATHTSGK